MNDMEIINLYIERSENAISETASQYGGYCAAIAMNILHNREDADECVNDTYLNLWNTIPPEHPKVFSTFIGAITRNLSLDRYRKSKSKKRGGSYKALLLSELEDCIPSSDNVEEAVDAKELTASIDTFLDTLKKDDMAYFVCRYWYNYSIGEIAEKLNASQGKVKMSLHRTRGKLKNYLEERGISV
jgi:RNA polymerase sigma-70 factor (ECF subfamily)